MKLLLIEDDAEVQSYVANGLRQAGHVVDTADNGRDGLFLAAGESYDMLIVDRMLPQVDGLTIIRTLRASENQTPVLILSALGEVDDRVKGLRAGGDDYLVKPFAFAELTARIDALARRAP
ncbi:MAG: response regulator transcription factor, partial [Rhodospirillaceae bacterium]